MVAIWYQHDRPLRCEPPTDEPNVDVIVENHHRTKKNAVASLANVAKGAVGQYPV